MPDTSSPALAIVIPALRAAHLPAALDSLAHQTDTRFTVYVGDDASGEDLRGVCSRFESSLALRYFRFEANLGGTDLPAHWDRCIALTSGEPLIWLFSDDDVMEPGCVAAVLAAAQQQPGVDLFRCDVTVVNAGGEVLRHEAGYPQRLSTREFLLGKLGGRFDSHAPEYAFRRSAYRAEHTFQRFPLAWGTDDAAWAQLALRGGLHTVSGPRVQWRESGQNISAPRPELVRTKVLATAKFLQWLHRFLEEHPAKHGEPTDAEVLTAARHWFYSHARGLGHRFGWWPDAEIFSTVAGLLGHGRLRTWLRMLDSDRYARRRAESGLHHPTAR